MLPVIMRAFRNVLKIAALCTVAGLAFGQAGSPPTGSVATPPTAPAPGESRWRLGAAFGYGQRSNPLIQSDDIPVLVDLDIAWFGKRWFFDNGDVGLTVLDRPNSTTSMVARVNSDRVFFGKTDTRYVNFAYRGNGMTSAIIDQDTGAQVDEPVEVNV